MPLNLPDSVADPRREMVTDYLDHLCGPLLGTVPLREREAIRAEVEDHLYGMIDEGEADGLKPDEATRAALHGYGEPWQIGQSFLETWCRYNTGRTNHAFFRTLPQGIYLSSFVVLGSSSAFCHLVTQANLLIPKPNATCEALAVAVNIAAPIVAGILSGAYAPVRTVRVVLLAIVPVLLHSLATGVAMLPARAGLHLLALQLVYWLPVVVISAAVIVNLRQYHRHATSLRRITG